MSKKQREKVEEEVNYHQTQNRLRANSASGTSPDPWQGPDSTGSGESCPPGYPGPGFPAYPDLGPGQGYSAPNQNPFYGTGGGGPGPGGQTQTQQFDEFVDSTTPNTTTPFDTRGGGNMQPGPDTDAQHLQGESHPPVSGVRVTSSAVLLSGMKSLPVTSRSGQHLSPLPSAPGGRDCAD